MVSIKVKDCMKSPVIMIEATKTIKDAAELMHSSKIGSLIISKEGSYDIITERDILKAVAENKLDYKLDITMEDPLITISQNAAIGDAAQKMLLKGFRHLVVTNEDDDIVGIVNVRDLVSAVHESFLALFEQL